MSPRYLTSRGEYWGTVCIQDVVAALRAVGSGTHSGESLYRRYVEYVEGIGQVPANFRAFSQALLNLGVTRHPGQPPTRDVDLEALAREWPDLPWKD